MKNLVRTLLVAVIVIPGIASAVTLDRNIPAETIYAGGASCGVRTTLAHGP